MEKIVGVHPDCKNYKVIDKDTGKDITKFCWAADDEAGLYAMFNNNGEYILATVANTDDEEVPRGERYIETYTCEGTIELVKK